MLRIAIVSVVAALIATGSVMAQPAARSSSSPAPQRFRGLPSGQPAVSRAPVMAARPRTKAAPSVPKTTAKPSSKSPAASRAPLPLVQQTSVQSADAAATRPDAKKQDGDASNQPLRSLDVGKLVDGMEKAIPRVGSCPKCGQRQFEGIFAQVYRRRLAQRKTTVPTPQRRLAQVIRK